MLDAAAIVIQVVQTIALVVILCVFSLVPITCIYLMFEGVRESVIDLEVWADRHNLLRRRRRNKYAEPTDAQLMGLISTNEFRRMQEYAEFDAELSLRSLYINPGRVIPFDPPHYDTVFEEVVADRGDPRDDKRLLKEQDAQDQETLDRATEYRNGIS